MLYLLVLLLTVGIPVSAVAALVLVLRLRERVRALELQLAGLQGRALAGAAAAPPREESPPLARPIPPAPEPEPPEAAEPARVVPSIAPAPEAAAAAPASPAPSRPGLEEQLGTRWAVWIGGIALALGGIFLVRYSIEQGLLGPNARIAAGAFFALALAGAGEWIRRREIALSLGGFPSAHIPSVLTAAGVLGAFATAYAAHALYGLVGPAATFALLGLISLLGMVASALHGPALAGLGLLAALATPLLVSSDTPRLWPVVIYLAFVAGAAYGLARLRLWRWLAASAAAGAVLWTMLLLLFSPVADLLPAATHLLVQTALACLVLAAAPYRATADAEARIDRIAAATLFAFAFLGVAMGASAHLGALRPPLATAMALLLLGTAVRFAPAATAAAWAGLVASGTLLVWPVAREIAGEMPTILPGMGTDPQPAALTTFLALGTALPLAIGGLSLRRVAQGPDLPRATASWYLGAAVLTPLACLVVAYWRVTELDRSLPFALVAALLAALFATAARLMRGRADGLAAGATACGALAALALGLTFALEKGMLTVAFALSALGTAWVAERAALPVLRYAVGAIGLLVLGRLIWDPTITGGDPGSLPILNWLLWGYGVPALAFFAASRILERQGRDEVTRFVESLALVFATFLVVFEIRHAVHGRITDLSSDYLEAGLVAASTLAFATLLVRVDRRRPDPVYRIGAETFSVASVLIAAFGLLLVYNPYLSGDPVHGGLIFNGLIPAYLLPAILAGGLALAARRTRSSSYVLTMGTLALVLHLAYMALAIRRFFHGEVVGSHLPVLEAEQWTYSLALIACGLAVLGIGLATGSRFLRLASVAYLILAVAKVFVVDLANLQGIMRALSFIGLGASLIGIGLIYQRLALRRPQATGP